MNGPGIGSWPARRARMNPATVALATDDESLTYAELAARVEATAAHLRELGVAAGERVAYLGPNSIDTFVLLLRDRPAGRRLRLAQHPAGRARDRLHAARQRQRACSCTGPSAPSWCTPPTPAAHGVKHVLAVADLREADGRRRRRRCRGPTTSSTSTTRR